jgi:HEPN domain-containing protein
MKQTAVEFLKKMLKDNSSEVFEGNIWEQAKELEKQQIIDAYASGYIDGVAQNKITTEQYYNDTFKK